jgi:hypothetical protein
MATHCLPCFVSLAQLMGEAKKESKNALGKGCLSSGYITKLDHSKFSLDIFGLTKYFESRNTRKSYWKEVSVQLTSLYQLV